MDINLIISTIFEYGSVLLTVMALLVFVTNIIVEVVKGLFPKLPTNILATIISMVITVVAMFVMCSIMDITVMWYYAVGAVVLGIFVGYAAMFGFDKFKAAWESIRKNK